MAGKSILVVDTPSSCKSCKFYDEWWCKIKDHCPEDNMGENGRAIWCPLRPLPQKRINKDCLVIHEIWNEGWNECLEDILGETE